MERKCNYCMKIFNTSGTAQFCPYCGRPMYPTAADCITDNGVAWAIETTWGNQATYAERIKGLCGKLIQQIHGWVAKKNNTVLEYESAQSITTQQLIDDFEFLRSAPNLEELDYEFQTFVRNLKRICSGDMVLRTTHMVSIDEKNYIIDNLHSFEAMLGLVTSENPEFCKEQNYAQSHSSTFRDFGSLFHAIERAYDCLKTIVQNQGFLSVQNCNYSFGKIFLLDEYSMVDSSGNTSYDLDGVIYELSKSCDNDYTDLLDEGNEKHLVLFFEGSWILLKGILDRFLYDEMRDKEMNCHEWMEEWLLNIEVSIDRAKCRQDVDMIGMYLTARKAYNITMRRFT